MTPKYLRLVFLSELLWAIIAVFTAWSEIGGQAVLDIMPWGWKFGLGLGLSLAFVAYTAAVVSGESIWNRNATKWFAAMILLVVGMGLITYYYALQVESTESGDEQENTPSLHSQLLKQTVPAFLKRDPA
jgi:hypothetical protein